MDTVGTHRLGLFVLAVLHGKVDVADDGLEGLGRRQVKGEERHQRMVLDLQDGSHSHEDRERGTTYQLHQCPVEFMEAATLSMAVPRRRQKQRIWIEVPRNVSARTSAVSRFVGSGVGGDEVHLGHDVYPWDLEVDHRRHGRKHAAKG